MLPKIEVLIVDRRMSIGYSRENDSAHRGDNLRALIIKWSSIVLDFISEILDKKSAIVYVYSSDGDFAFPPGIHAKIWTHKNNGINYFLAASNTWRTNDMIEIISLMEFELSSLWIQIVSEINESQIDPVEFFRSVDKIVIGEEIEDEHLNLERIGSIEDGNKIIWDNPNWNKFDDILSKLRTLCVTNGFNCLIEDQRNKI